LKKPPENAKNTPLERYQIPFKGALHEKANPINRPDPDPPCQRRDDSHSRGRCEDDFVWAEKIVTKATHKLVKSPQAVIKCKYECKTSVQKVGENLGIFSFLEKILEVEVIDANKIPVNSKYRAEVNVNRLPVNPESLSPSDRRVIVIIGDNDSAITPGIPHYTMSKAKKLFTFPPNHPSKNTAYAMAEVYPDVYRSFTDFHEYFKGTKNEDFYNLCASLGAKEIYLESAEINDRNLDLTANVKAPLANLGLNFTLQQNRETGEIIAYKFPEQNKGIRDYDSPWMPTEPTWRSMNNLRRKHYLSEVGVQFNYTDDMGINANLAANIKGVGINIGGSFHEMTKIHLSYKVVFW